MWLPMSRVALGNATTVAIGALGVVDRDPARRLAGAADRLAPDVRPAGAGDRRRRRCSSSCACRSSSPASATRARRGPGDAAARHRANRRRPGVLARGADGRDHVRRLHRDPDLVGGPLAVRCRRPRSRRGRRCPAGHGDWFRDWFADHRLDRRSGAAPRPDHRAGGGRARSWCSPSASSWSSCMRRFPQPCPGYCSVSQARPAISAMRRWPRISASAPPAARRAPRICCCLRRPGPCNGASARCSTGFAARPKGRSIRPDIIGPSDSVLVAPDRRRPLVSAPEAAELTGGMTVT